MNTSAKQVRWLLIAAALLVCRAPSSSAQSDAMWRDTLPDDISGFKLAPTGHILVGLKNTLIAIDPESGRRVWSRSDISAHEIIPGTSIALVRTPAGHAIVDLETGRDRWTVSTLPFKKVKGFVHLSTRGLVLVYGETAESRHSLIAARYDSGGVAWRHDSLYAAPHFAKDVGTVAYTDRPFARRHLKGWPRARSSRLRSRDVAPE